MNRFGRVNLTTIAFCVVLVLGLSAFLIPATWRPSPTTQRKEAVDKVKQIVIACLHYELLNEEFPSDIRDANGKPLLSWRVAILPFIERQDLYKRFHLDEPWDSANNCPLLEQMPKVFESSTVQLPPGMCKFLGVSGAGTAFGFKSLKLRDIQDGATQTVFLVEVHPDHAVPWTQPADWKLDPAFPLRGLGNVRPSGFYAGFADGSMRFIKPDIDPATWRALLTIAGGELVGEY